MNLAADRKCNMVWLRNSYLRRNPPRARERVPLDWAMTQNNLANALATLGERESGAARLEEAIVAFDACLTVTETAWPEEWVQQVRSHRDETRAEITRRRAK